LFFKHNVIHRIAEGLSCERASGSSLVQCPLLKQGHLELVAQVRVNMAFGYLQGGILHSLSDPVRII